MNYFKLDGFFGSATPPSGQLPIMEAATKLLDELRSIDNDLFINITIGSWPSPFWLNLVDCTWRGGADMDMMGVGTKSQQWITYRDAITYKNIVKGSPLYPLNSLMVQGIAYANHHRASAEGMINDSEKDFKDQVHSFFGAGYNVQELYISQDRMTKPYWDALAEAAKWSRENESIFIDAHWIGGNPEELQVYGWASWQPQKGIITLRNPSDSKQKFTINLQEHLELPNEYFGKYLIKSKWGSETETSEIISSENIHEIELVPFEVKILEIFPSN